MVLPLIGAIAGGLISASASNKAAKAGTNAARNELALQQQIYDETSANFAPYREQGLQGFNALNYEMGLGARPEGYAGFQASPGYQFALDQGMNALEGSASAGGNVRSGATQKAILGYSQGLANQEYGNYLNRLGGVAQMGQAAAGNQATAGANFAAGAGQAYGNLANAQAAGTVGVANALNTGIGNAMGAYQMNQVMGNPGFNIGGQNSLFGGNSWG